MKWLFFVMTLPLFGAYVGNPADPALMSTGFFSTTYPFFKFTSGYIYDYTSNKRYVGSDSAAIKKFGLHSQLASFSLILVERIQFFGTAGSSKEVLKEEPTYQSILDAYTNYHFSWSVGSKLIFLQWGQTYLSGDFTYFAIPPSSQSFLKYLTRLNLPTVFDDKKKLSLEEWQLSLALSSRFFFLTPYGGISYLKSRLHAEIDYHNDVRIGYFYGLTVSLTGRFHLNFERRVRDEFAYTFSTIAVF